MRSIQTPLRVLLLLCFAALCKMDKAVASCGSNADCSFPSGICQAGGCLCDGQHTGATCSDLTAGILHTLLAGGFWGVCTLSLFGGLFVGGVVRFVQHRLQASRETDSVKGMMFSYGDVDTFHYRSTRKKSKKRKKKKSSKKKKQKEDV